jgi:hypothetical protein
MTSAFDEILLNHDDGDITVEHAILALDGKNQSQINFLSSATPTFFSGKAGGNNSL